MTTSSSTGTDSFVQTAPDGGGKSVAATLVTRDDGSQVYRQEVISADPLNSDAKASVVGGEPMDVAYGLVVRPLSDDAKAQLELLQLILDELVQIRHILAG